MKTKSNGKSKEEIQSRIESFCSKYLDMELQKYSITLLETIHKKPLLNINRGKNEIWAASIIYVIARLNFLFDKNSDHYISVNEICEHFNVKKTTIGNKATQIERAYNIQFGDKKYTKPDIAVSLKFYMTPEGFIVPSSMAQDKKIIVEIAEGEELEELIRYEEEQERKREEELRKKKERRAEINRKIGEAKRKKRHRGQMNLFDDLEN